jgi:hypothetical protein
MEQKSDRERYYAAAHAMQSGVAMSMNIAFPSPDTTPKHLRVGINSAMCDHTALVRLLIAKGLFTEAEYAKEIADEMEREKERYERELSEHYRKPITLA